MLEDIVMYPFICLGRVISFFNHQEKEYEIYLFFPFYHIGGAEKIHAQVAQACCNPNCIIYFTKKSHNDLFKKEFEKSRCVVRDISTYTDNKWMYFLNLTWRGIISGYMNRQKKRPVLLNGQCNFGYKVSPWIRKEIPQVEIIHSLNTFSYIRIPYIPFISKTVMISYKRIEDHKDLYKKYKIPSTYLNRIQYISNAVPLDGDQPVKNTRPFTVLFAGRGGPEKRLHLVAAIAKEINKINTTIRFEILGDVAEWIDPKEYPFIKLHGAISNEKEVNTIYRHATVLLLTSSTEGFPLVVIEAMGHGCAIVATPVGDIPYHVHNGTNGFLFSTITDEQKIINEGVQHIMELCNNSSLLHQISLNNMLYAKEHFSIEKFNEAYRELLNSLNPAV